jgi:hypothetical protein
MYKLRRDDDLDISVNSLRARVDDCARAAALLSRGKEL